MYVFQYMPYCITRAPTIHTLKLEQYAKYANSLTKWG